MGGECDREEITEENTPALESASTVSGEKQGRGVYYSGLLARMGRESDREEETEGKTPALEIDSMLAGLSAYKYWELEKEGLLPLCTIRVAEMFRSRRERNKEYFLSFVQCQKSVNDARNLEQSVSMVKSRIEWLEPSQNCVSWVTVDDHTLQQFMDRWTVLVTIFKTTASTQPVRETNFHL
ncbi:hypothetical protein MAR_021733 [Mya arenaria]|uniref:Uncharacterized protein n=1 Tax=Mya arenaria TaxID=6604 RepID=A0ABY7ED95_MYAAR|nr:hypothetical protein MAR_021733 [Mya arenaria]